MVIEFVHQAVRQKVHHVFQQLQTLQVSHVRDELGAEGAEKGKALGVSRIDASRYVGAIAGKVEQAKEKIFEMLDDERGDQDLSIERALLLSELFVSQVVVRVAALIELPVDALHQLVQQLSKMA